LPDEFAGLLLIKAGESMICNIGVHDNQYKNISLESLESSAKSCFATEGLI
jgi:hypothetical protein